MPSALAALCERSRCAALAIGLAGQAAADDHAGPGFLGGEPILVEQAAKPVVSAEAI
jgi:hypothetical protein